MDAVPATVTHALPLRLLDATGTALCLTAELRYDASDPYAIDAVFQTGEPKGVRWVFARDLLAEGLSSPTGDGDVRVWPHTSSAGAIVLIKLRSPDGQALLEAPRDGLERFLQSTYAIVPPGMESSQVDLDLLVNGLLDGGNTGPAG